jgi:uncharacterized LabA/DUF88 family protein
MNPSKGNNKGKSRRRRSSRKQTKQSTQSQPANNYAFIDNENVNITIQRLGWKIDRAKLRKRLEKELDVQTAYMFMGYLPEYQEMYTFFQQIGYTLIFKPMNTNPNVPNKGNVDAELVLQAMIDIDKYDQAVVVTGDGDFACLVRYLVDNKKLGQLVVPNKRRYAEQLKHAAGDQISFLSGMKRRLAYRSGRGKKK